MKAVVLIHGLMTNSLVMTYLGAKIRSNEYKVYYFNYQSRKYSDKTLQELNYLIESIKEENVYLVGHSMGGLVIRNYIHKEEYEKNFSKIKSVITIATPHNQSVIAQKVQQLFDWFLGTAHEVGLTKDIGHWNSKIPLGCIAGIYEGNWNAHLFLMFTKVKNPSDGTVLVEEAILIGCKDSIVIEGSHTGLLFQKNVVKQIINFLINDCFDK